MRQFPISILISLALKITRHQPSVARYQRDRVNLIIACFVRYFGSSYACVTAGEARGPGRITLPGLGIAVVGQLLKHGEFFLGLQERCYRVSKSLAIFRMEPL